MPLSQVHKNYAEDHLCRILNVLTLYNIDLNYSLVLHNEYPHFRFAYMWCVYMLCVCIFLLYSFVHSSLPPLDDDGGGSGGGGDGDAGWRTIPRWRCSRAIFTRSQCRACFVKMYTYIHR